MSDKINMNRQTKREGKKDKYHSPYNNKHIRIVEELKEKTIKSPKENEHKNKNKTKK
jgi:hypothetical protein